MALYGRTRKAILETIRICKDRNVLREYLESRENEVVDIMMLLYDEEEIMRSYVECEVYEATQRVAQQVTQQGRIETARRMLEDGSLPMDKIVKFSVLPMETVQQLADSL